MFGENVQLSGFVGLFLAIIAMTVVKELLMFVDSKLDTTSTFGRQK